MGPTELMTVGAVGAGLAALAVLALLVARRRPDPVGIRASALALSATVPVLGVTVLVVLGRGVDSRWFVAAHTAYLGLVVSVPILGAGLAVATLSRWARPAACFVAVGLLVPAPAGWYATHRAPYDLRVDRVDLAVPAARSGRGPVRIGVLADLQTSHVGGYEHRAVSRLLALDPDLIVVAGDLFQGNPAQFLRELPALRREVRRLRAPGGVFAVRGDVDTGDRLDRVLAGSGVRILDDEVVRRSVAGRSMAIGGNRLLWAPQSAEAVRTELMAAAPGEIRILLSHRPDAVLLLPPSSGVDLVVSGHTHGGQVALPGLGPVEYASNVSRRVAAGGLHRVSGNPVYVSTGVGLSREQAPQVRFLTRPSIGLITLG